MSMNASVSRVSTIVSTLMVASRVAATLVTRRLPHDVIWEVAKSAISATLMEQLTPTTFVR